MTSRKFYRTTFKVEFLSEEPLDPQTDLRDLLEDATTGGLSGDVSAGETEVLDGKQAADALHKQRSDPGFFHLTDEGEDNERAL